MAPKDKAETLLAQQVKVPKGTRDWFGADVILRDHIFQTLSQIFKNHGGTPLDTPVFELKEVLTGKYGEDQRLIYDLADQGGEFSALRYDLTVPFARWLALTGITQVKRYQIAKVYRRDQPAMNRGRLREFYQCDFDIAGVYDPMIPDAEILRIIYEAFRALQLDIKIKLNHRKILDGIFKVSGVPDEKIRTISSAVDKLDKMAWVDVKKEMVEEKGLPSEVADRIGSYVQRAGGIIEVVEYIKSDPDLSNNSDIQAGLTDLNLLATYSNAFGIIDKISFDLSLARGLDYYTGLIYEVVPNDKSSQVGSIAAGGRYDELAGMFRKQQIPCVGISFGLDRIFTVLKSRKDQQAAESEIDVYVMAFGGKEFDGLLVERMAILTQLWDSGIRAEFTAKVKPRLPQQFKAAASANVPIAVILGQDELAAGQVRIKVLGLPDDHAEKEGILVAKADVASEVEKRLKKPLEKP